MKVLAGMTADDRIRFRTYGLSLVVSALILGLKFVAYKVTGSQAIFSDALESIINVITPMVGLFVIWLASKPADKEHPYGHGKIEYFSAAFEGGLILFAAVLILFEAGNAFFNGVELRSLETGLAFIGVAGVANFLLGLYVLKIGEKYKSTALIANGRHILADVWTTAGVLIGLFMVRLTGIKWLDPVAATLVGVLLAIDGFRLVRESAGGLMDEEDVSILESLIELFTRHRIPGIIHIHHTRVIRSGRYHHIDAHVVVPQFWDVATSHESTGEFEARVIHDYPVDGEIHFHIDPCRQAYCHVCPVETCPIRLRAFEVEMPFSIDSLVSPNEPDEYRESL